MIRIIAAALAAIFCFPALAQSEDWVALAKASSAEYHAQRNSVLYTPAAVSFVVRARMLNQSSVELYRAVISRADCAARAGSILFASLDLTTERFRAEFALGAGNVGSSIAASLCGQLQYETPDSVPGGARAPSVRVL